MSSGTKLKDARHEFAGLFTRQATPDDHAIGIMMAVEKRRDPISGYDVIAARAAQRFIPIKAMPLKEKGARAYVNHGKWKADCPNPVCNGAEAVHLEGPQFWCGSCLNRWGDVGGAMLKIRLLTATKRVELEDILFAREADIVRHWHWTWSEAQFEARGHRSWTTPITYTTGQVLTAANLNTSGGRDNELALDATFDRLLAQRSIASGPVGAAGTTVRDTLTVVVNDAGDKIMAVAAINFSTASPATVHIRDNTDGVNGPIQSRADLNISAFTVAALFTAPTVATHTIELRSGSGGTEQGSWLLAWVIPNNV